MDNYFTSFNLLQGLRDNLGILATGTMRQNRIPSYPFDDEKKFTPRGSMEHRYNGPACVHLVAWQDNKRVVVASTLYGADPVTTTSRYSRTEGHRVDLPRPAVVKHYNNTMGGVDILDTNVSNCWTKLRGKKWYFSIVLYLLDVSCVNAWLNYRLSVEHPKDYNTFRTEVATSFLAKNDRAKPSVPARGETHHDNVGHLIDFTARELRCKVCSKNSKFSYTNSIFTPKVFLM